ncbi:MAG: amidohydrolase, partial [Rhodoluna sp.]|nr:amidohydrolase [Rhodoluna sp.]
PGLVVDLENQFVMPGFRDGHCHPLFAGREHLGPNVTDATSLPQIQEILVTYGQANPDDLWIDGAAYDRSIDAKFVRSELDAAIADRPVVLHGADHHTLWVNTRALEISGLMDSVPDLSVGSVDLGDDGLPNGILREWEAMQLVMGKIPALSLEKELECLSWAQELLFRNGVVEVQDAWIDPGMVEVYVEAARRDGLILKTDLAFRADPKTWKTDFGYFDERREEVSNLGHPLLTADTMKFFVDGVLGSSTASVLEPYVAGPSTGSHGELVWDKSALLDAANQANASGYQLHLHAIGDLGVRTALDIIETVGTRLPAVIAHTELVSDADITRFAKLNVVANFEPLWAREDGQLLSCVHQVGRARLDTMYRMRDLADSGAIISFGSDWPVSSPIPIAGIATAVTRALQGGPGWSLGQALNIGEALAAYTSGSASQISCGQRNGLLKAGSPAEFVILSANPFVLESQALFDLQVIGTSSKSRPFTK